MRRVVRWVAAALGAVLLLAVAAYAVAGLRKTPLDDAERARAQRDGRAHEFAPLGDGVTHYRLEGPADGPVVVLVHGFSNGSYVWDDYFAPLAAAGYRVLALDLYGRGFSDRPATAYSPELFTRQILGLLDALHLAQPVHLVGYSMGGAIVTELAAHHPERVRSTTLIAPAGLGAVMPNALLTAPVLGDWIFRVLGPAISDRYVGAELLQAAKGESLLVDYRRQAAYAGYEAALLSTMRSFPLTGAGAAFDELGRSGKPVLVFWGRSDPVVPFALSAELQRRAPQASLQAFDDQTHAITYAHPELVLPPLLAFLGTRRDGV
ncbi:MAG: alpha/beta fold hydrolase [Candidatus Binatia bacterium]